MRERLVLDFQKAFQSAVLLLLILEMPTFRMSSHGMLCLGPISDIALTTCIRYALSGLTAFMFARVLINRKHTISRKLPRFS